MTPIQRVIWLGGLDSNQDSQLQRLMYYRLYDLPAEGDERNGPWRVARSFALFLLTNAHVWVIPLQYVNAE
jgi:hypothetical protein